MHSAASTPAGTSFELVVLIRFCTILAMAVHSGPTLVLSDPCGNWCSLSVAQPGTTGDLSRAALRGDKTNGAVSAAIGPSLQDESLLFTLDIAPTLAEEIMRLCTKTGVCTVECRDALFTTFLEFILLITGWLSP